MKIFSSKERNLGEILRKSIEQYDVISFDVFDTLIFRNVARPKDIFYFVEKRYNKKYNCVSNFFHNRIKAERKARKKYSYTEVNFDEIYDELKKYYTAEQCSILSKMEIEAELDFCTVNIEMQPIYNYAVKLNKKIFIITDMYLSSKVIKEILTLNGYTNFSGIFVSGEFHKTKHEGSLFFQFLKDTGINSKSIIHIGDSKRADYLMPQKAGMAALQYLTTIKYPGHCSPSWVDRKRDIQYSSLCSFLKNHISSDENLYFEYGYSLYGSLLYGYLEWLFHQCKQENVDKILFLSRDGYILRIGFNLLYRNCIDNTYFYVSRKAIVGALLHYDTSVYETVNRYKSWPYKFTFKFFLSKVNVSVNELPNDYYFDLEKEYTISEFIKSEKVCEEYRFIKNIMDHKSIIQEKLLKQYFEELNLFGKKIAIVDIGSRCTIARNLNEFINRNCIDLVIYGFYLEIQDKKSRMRRGYLFSREENADLNFLLSSYYYFLEIYLSAPHGTVKAYYNKNYQIMPVLEPYDYKNEDEEKDIVEMLQKGSLKFCNDFQALGKKYFNITPQMAINNLKKFGIFPYPSDLQAWKNFQFNADGLEPLINRRRKSEYIFSLSSFINDYKKSLWKGGFWVNLLGTNIFNNLLIHLKLLLKGIKKI